MLPPCGIVQNNTLEKLNNFVGSKNALRFYNFAFLKFAVCVNKMLPPPLKKKFPHTCLHKKEKKMLFKMSVSSE